MKQYKITVFTPTYNRAYRISKLYQSLKMQTYNNFEWIVVDDGSTDNTQDLFNQILLDNTDNFIIKYYKQNNGGKCRAINKGLEKSDGELFFIVDSDDYLFNHSLQLINDWVNTISESDDKFAGVSGLKCYENNDIVGKTFDGTFVDATAIERNKFHIEGDKAEVFLTDILRKYSFPAFDNETFMNEAIVWNRIGNDGYKFRWFNEKIYVCEYLEDGLSHNIVKKLSENFEGYSLFVKEYLSYSYPLYIKVKMLCKYLIISKSNNITTKEAAIRLDINLILVKFCNSIITLRRSIQKLCNILIL